MSNNNSKEQLKQEYLRCIESPLYFVNKYVKVQHPIRGIIPFSLYGFQNEVLSNFSEHQFNIILKSRQMGISTLVAAYCLWLMTFHKNKTILIVSLKQEDAKEVLSKIRLAYENLEEWLKVKCAEDNRLSIKFENGSEVQASSTTKKSGIGKALSLLIIDEAAHIDEASELWISAQPSLSTGGSAIILSTPCGVGNWFHQMWVKAEEDPKKIKPNKLPWNLHPERDEDWRRIEGEKIGDARRAAEAFDVNFLASGRTLVDGDTIIKYQGLCVEPMVKKENGLRIYVDPVENHRYIIGGDPASGYGEDNSACHVLDLSTNSVEQVVSFRGKMSPTDFANMLVNLALEYNNAPLAVERNGLGLAVITQIINLEYSGLVCCSGDLSQIVLLGSINSEGIVPGFPTNVRTRMSVTDRIEEYIRLGLIKIKDSRLIEELLVFVEKNGKYQAASGYTDDMVMALGIGLLIGGTLFKHNTRGVEMTKNLLNAMKRTTSGDEKINTTPIGRGSTFYNSGHAGSGKQYWQQNIKGNSENIRWLLD
jgi:hypothetical protein